MRASSHARGRAVPRLATALVASAALVPTAVAAQAGYHDFAGLTAELRSLADGSDAATLSSIGTTLEGREIWVVEIGAPSGVPLDERPGVLVVGNLEGSHLVGSSHAVEIVRHLLNGAEGTAEVLEGSVVYVIPRLNPDAAEAWFASPRWNRSGNARPFDDDNDGRVDEDGPEDLNGDGVITVMRVPDTSGSYRIDEDDPRLMAVADPVEGASGTHEVYWEGVDSDGDGFLNEDWEGGVDLDRNFQHAYPYYEHLAGPHMVSERESRALMDFVIAHRNIAAILTFGTSDNLVVPPDAGGALASPRALDLVRFAEASNEGVFEVGVFEAGGGGFGFGFFGGGGFRGAQPGRDNDPSSGRRPATTVHGDDRPYLETISEAYREITGIEQVGLSREPEGAFFQYGYFQFGVPSFITPGWGLPSGAAGEEDEAEGEPGGEGEAEPAGPGGARGGPAGRGGGRGGDGGGAGVDAELLEAFDAAGIEVFANWSPYAHPELGEVEIGGFLPYAAQNPPASELAGLGRAHGEFVARLTGMLPRVRIVDTGVTAHGGGVFTVEAEIENGGRLPTSLRHGIVSESVQPVTVQIQVDPDDVLTGATKTSTIARLDGSGARERFTWVIRGQPGAQVEIRVRSQKGGNHAATVTLR